MRRIVWTVSCLSCCVEVEDFLDWIDTGCDALSQMVKGEHVGDFEKVTLDELPRCGQTARELDRDGESLGG
ncbi:MAG: hypothetical protein A2139_00935 [Desulfobacca sp. RBG_16_60_12]|nr:MAG: hypothetical protein A2139_00935 [Desulfobacca sp. RBG_16_60_12]